MRSQESIEVKILDKGKEDIMRVKVPENIGEIH